MTTNCRFLALAAVCQLAAASAASALSYTHIEDCGAVVVGAAILRRDLHCTDPDTPAIHFAGGGSLDMQGHEITSTGTGISAERSLRLYSTLGASRIQAPLAIRGGDGSTYALGPKLDITGLDIVGRVLARRLHMRDGSVTGVTSASDPAVSTIVYASLVRTVVAGNAGVAVVGGSVRLRDSEITDNGGHGIVARIVTVIGSAIDGNDGGGISAQSHARVLGGSSITGNALFGLLYEGLGRNPLASGPEIGASAVTANVSSPQCASQSGNAARCADIASSFLPVLRRGGSCDTSSRLTDGEPWGVCAED
ncbi:MAG TPA: hypothetical protein VEL28_18860 [Candidatus Binatia bacterium]|nr:hypothetical protein [Candidatus Binatia bacterium]